ncbi:MAG: hypothetical protein M1438_11045 [Deltaproteobacteria bacterium]|nr:hypothetical protein [Deltaproteobacteria bacterium]
MAKRPSLKGRGADIFLGEEAGVKAGQNAGMPAGQQAEKATFYLPAELLVRLDNLWMSLRKSDRKLKKSHLVSELLDKGIREMESETQ